MLIRPWKKEKKGKYGAKKVTIDGIVFDSAMEGDYYLFMKKKREGLPPIFQLVPHPPKIILASGVAWDGKKVVIDWKPDFFDPLEASYIDVKGAETQRFRLLKKLIRLNPTLKIIKVTKLPGLSNPWKEERI